MGKENKRWISFTITLLLISIGFTIIFVEQPTEITNVKIFEKKHYSNYRVFTDIDIYYNDGCDKIHKMTFNDISKYNYLKYVVEKSIFNDDAFWVMLPKYRPCKYGYWRGSRFIVIFLTTLLSINLCRIIFLII